MYRVECKASRKLADLQDMMYLKDCEKAKGLHRWGWGVAGNRRAGSTSWRLAIIVTSSAFAVVLFGDCTLVFAITEENFKCNRKPHRCDPLALTSQGVCI